MPSTPTPLRSTSLLLAAALILITGHVLAAQDKPQPAQTQSDVIAIVNGKPLTKNDFRTFINIRTGNRLQKGGLSQEQLQSLLVEYINRELIYQEALKKGYDRVPEVATVIDNHRRNILASYTAQQVINQPLSDEELRQAYEKYLAHPTVEYKTRHILVNSEKEALQVIHALDKGADFAQLAKKRSIDASAKNGGSLDWFSTQEVIPPFREALRKLKPGQYTRQPVHSRYGWHAILLENTREVPPPPFEAARDKARNLAQSERLARHIDALRKQSKIELVQPKKK